MRKIAMILGVLLVSSTCAFAMPDRTEKTDIGFHIGGLLPDSTRMDSGVYYGGSASYGVNDWFAVGVESGFEDARTNFQIGTTEHQAHISHIPLFLDLIFRYTKTEYDYVPYGVLGLGMLFTDIHGTGTLRDANLKLNVDNSFAIKLGAGVDWFVNDKWILNFEASYVWADANAQIKDLSTGNTFDSINMDYWAIEGGLKYLFD